MTIPRDRSVYDGPRVNSEFRLAGMRLVAAHLPAVVDMVDRKGFWDLFRKARCDDDLSALIELLADAADLNRLAAVTGYRVPGRRGEAGVMPGEDKGAAREGRAA